MKKLLLILCAIPVFCQISFSQLNSNYHISISIPELRDSTLYLAYHYGDKQYLSDTIVLDASGKGVFQGEKTLSKGIYLVVLPGNTYFEILLSDNQEFEISCSYPRFSETLSFSSSSENTAFLAYQRQWSTLQKEATAISRRIQNNSKNSDSLTILNNSMMEKESEMKDYLWSVVNNNQSSLLSALVKSIIPIDIPEPVIPANCSNPDSLKWYFRYNYNKDHFFDHIDFTDERLLRTPIIHSRLESFFTNILMPTPDSINKEIDKLMKKCESSHDMFQYVAVYLFNRYRTSEIMGHDAVIFKIAEDYYLNGKADWVTQEFLDDLERQVELMRYNLIGLPAKDLVMNSYKDVYVSLYDIEKDFTILYFWEPSCGHCKETTPKLQEFYKTAKDNGIEVFAICTTDAKEDWSKYIQENNIDWINGWDPERTTHFDYYYNVQATPLIYILDRDKKIIAKKLSVEDLSSFIENYRAVYYK